MSDAPLVTLEEVREFCRLDANLDAGQDSELETLRDAAVEQGEHITGYAWEKRWKPENFPRSLKLWVLNRIAAGMVAGENFPQHMNRLLDRWISYDGKPKRSDRAPKVPTPRDPSDP